MNFYSLILFIFSLIKSILVFVQIISNTTISRPDPVCQNPVSEEAGGLSGKPLFSLSTNILKEMYILTRVCPQSSIFIGLHRVSTVVSIALIDQKKKRYEYKVHILVIESSSDCDPLFQGKIPLIGCGGISWYVVSLHYRSWYLLLRIRFNSVFSPLLTLLIHSSCQISGEDAYKKIRSGASLVQLYTGFAYGGPALIPQIKVYLHSCCQNHIFFLN